jgi:membrane dipeptidase
MLAGETAPRGSTAAAAAAENASAAVALLRRSISIDVHSHGGKTGISSKAPPSDDLADHMRAGSLAVACLADVPDGPILGRDAAGALSALRPPRPGELYAHHLERLAWMDRLVADHAVRRALCAADLEAAHRAGEPAIVADVEGLDFLDGSLERLEEAHQRGLRHLQLVHYTPNDIGDFQTGAVTHHGLTDFGAEVIGACHRLGFVCDVAHATEAMVKHAVRVATKPLLLSHTAVSGSRAMGPTPLAGRQVTPDHARAIAATGGAVGVWHFFPSLDKYVDGLKEMADIVGVDHVSIGTDQFDARGCVADYTKWVHLIAAMLRGGFTAEEGSPAAITCASSAPPSADPSAAPPNCRASPAAARSVPRSKRGSCSRVKGKPPITQRPSGSGLAPCAGKGPRVRKTNKRLEPGEAHGGTRHQQPFHPLQPQARVARPLIEFGSRRVAHRKIIAEHGVLHSGRCSRASPEGDTLVNSERSAAAV